MDSNQAELTNDEILAVLTLAPASGSDPRAEAAAGAQLLEADRMAGAL
jgi:hypothetical protein